jgi:2-polyprenyl-6-methoxyphenol hydroxylase-like FAD-dependent oxidoreductase
VLIGCDGVHSVTRTIIDPGAPKPRYVGLLNFGGYTPNRVVGEPGAWHMIFGTRAFFGYVPDAAGGTVWFANVPRHATSRSERAITSMDQWKEWLIRLFADDRGPASELIAAGALQLAGDNTHDLPSVPTWHQAPLMIIGDAAHAPSPSSGQGASLAVEDGVVLAQCLRDEPGIHQAFTAFERIRRGRVERVVAQGARSSSSKAAGPIGRIVRDHMLPFVFRYLVTERSLAWMFDHHIDWNSPIARNQRVA